MRKGWLSGTLAARPNKDALDEMRGLLTEFGVVIKFSYDHSRSASAANEARC
jgi:hypothetical protein